MLRLTIEIVPFGIEGEKRTIQTVEISRKKLTGNPCDYRVTDGDIVTEVKGHRYEDGATVLAGLALAALLEAKND